MLPTPFFRRPLFFIPALGLGFVLAKGGIAENLSFETILTQLSSISFTIHPELEREEAGEFESLKQVAWAMFQVQMRNEPLSRDAHAKGHACAEARFTVEPNLPESLRVGFLGQTEPYDAIVRFSNGSGVTKADAIPDGRGMALKLLGGAPKGNLLNTGTTQDFLLINSPRFFVRSLADYALFQNIVLQQGKPDAFFLARAVREALNDAGRADAETLENEKVLAIMGAIAQFATDPSVLESTLANLFGAEAAPVKQALRLKLAQMQQKTAPRELSIAMELARPIGSSLNESYFSMASYLFAQPSGDTAVKYSAEPVHCETEAKLSPEIPPTAPNDNYLREDLGDRLAKGEACYHFYLQFLPTTITGEQKRTLVEDSRLDYGTNKILVAKIRLPQQEVRGADRQQYCELLSFNPWQANPANAPLGSMNRARKWAVTGSSIRRHLLRGEQRAEPTSLDAFRALR